MPWYCEECDKQVSVLKPCECGSTKRRPELSKLGTSVVAVSLICVVAIGTPYFALRSMGGYAPEWFRNWREPPPPPVERHVPARHAKPDPPRDSGPHPEKITAFKKWCLAETCVTMIEFKWGNDNFFVRLVPSKLTTQPNTKAIAQSLARYYCNQVGRQSATCHVEWGMKFIRGSYSKTHGAI